MKSNEDPPECQGCGREMIRMEDGTYECDYCCGDPRV
jgi:hypothetical protein